jgi:hypothetical protein
MWVKNRIIRYFFSVYLRNNRAIRTRSFCDRNDNPANTINYPIYDIFLPSN